MANPEALPGNENRDLSVEDTAAMVLCKPKILPLKSVSLEKLEKLQRAALEAAQLPEGAPKKKTSLVHGD
uniref:BBIP1 n=1 Tax=Malurus cyaneus samueli TaxID=2593467 RepID=A0A8C5T710_9PASS